MKKVKFLYGALGIMALGMTACSSEDIAIKENVVSEDTDVRFMRVAIANPPSTRAAEFEDGTEDENRVKNLFFKFYDATGAPIPDSQTTLVDVKKEPNGDIQFETQTPGNGDVGKYKSITVQVTLPRRGNYPSYVVCFVNPVNYDEINGTTVKNMNDLRGQIRDNYKANDGSFAMNNSVYYGNDPVSGGVNVRMFATPILASQLKTTKQDADEATGDDVVNIYVERYAAKVKFTLGDDAVEPVTVGAYNLTFVPEAWSINADADDMYAAKRYADSNATTTTIPTFSQVQTMLGGWTSWNDEPNKRSYWACSPSYYATSFPQVSDNIIDQASAGTTGAGEKVGDYELHYYSYNQVTDPELRSQGLGVTDFNDGGTNWKYTMENTMGKQAFMSLNPSAAAPSVILVGHYELSTNVTTPGGEGEEPTITNVKLDPNIGDGFCIYNGEIYFRNTVPTGVQGATRMLTKFLDENAILAINATGTLLKASNAQTNNLTDYFEVVHPNKAVRGQQAIPHRYVTLQLKTNLTSLQGLYYKPAGSDTWMSLQDQFAALANEGATAGSAPNDAQVDFINSINTLLWQQLGNASSYTKNKCYFSIPIQHLGITENTADPSPIADGHIDWTKVRVGDFGLVRNHVYSLSVSEISGVANGIENLDNPLVPSMAETDYWIRYQVNILNWRVVPAQNNIIL